MKKIAILAFLATAGATPALAQPGDTDAPAFTGPRVEVFGGLDFVESAEEGLPDDEAVGVAYGLGVGYDVGFGRMVAGIEAEFADSTFERCVLADDEDEEAGEVCIGSKHDLYVGGRLGYVVADNTLVYLKAGYTKFSPSIELVDVPAGEGDDVVNELDVDLDGLRLGIGAEFAITRNGFIKTEYRYSNYELDVERHQAVAGIGFRF